MHCAHARFLPSALALLLAAATVASAQGGGTVSGKVTDETGGVLPGVTVELRGATGNPASTVTDAMGHYEFTGVAPGTCQLLMTLVNFGAVNHRGLEVRAGSTITNDEVMHLSLNADAVVIGKRTLTNLADVEHAAEDLVGIAASAWSTTETSAPPSRARPAAATAWSSPTTTARSRG
jgi:hypothetical protein